MLLQPLLVIYPSVIQNQPMGTKSEAAIREADNRRAQLKRWIDERHNGSQAAFVSAHKLNQGEISSLLKNKSFGSVKARNLEAQVGMPERFLELIAESSNELVTPTQTSVVADDCVRIPVLANSGAMGAGSEMLDGDYVVGDLALSPHWINQYIRPASIRELRFIHAHGDSMAPTFSDGDVLLVDSGAKDPASHEGVYVLEVHGKVYIKRVRMRMDGTLEVSSDNVTIKTVDVLNGEHQVRVLGRVVWAWNGRKL